MLIESNTFDAEKPWAMPVRSNCDFYHSMDFPDGESATGVWDIRGLFDQYIGNYPVCGKTVLDVGTASGFLAFSAEAAGARVTALEGLHISEHDRIHFRGSKYHYDRAAYVKQAEDPYHALKAAFWFSWHKFNSHVEMIYAPLNKLPYWGRKFDVVFAGAILEHLADPISVIGSLANIATEAVVIAFTPVADSDDQYMETANDWSNPSSDFTFWTLSRGLYHRLFENVGFTMEIVPVVARFNNVEIPRPTIIARRITTDPSRLTT